jgi:hypothetical protein
LAALETEVFTPSYYSLLILHHGERIYNIVVAAALVTPVTGSMISCGREFRLSLKNPLVSKVRVHRF